MGFLTKLYSWFIGSVPSVSILRPGPGLEGTKMMEDEDSMDSSHSSFTLEDSVASKPPSATCRKEESLKSQNQYVSSIPCCKEDGQTSEAENPDRKESVSTEDNTSNLESSGSPLEHGEVPIVKKDAEDSMEISYVCEGNCIIIVIYSCINEIWMSIFLMRPDIHIKAFKNMHDSNQMIIWTCFEVFRQEWQFWFESRLFLEFAYWHIFPCYFRSLVISLDICESEVSAAILKAIPIFTTCQYEQDYELHILSILEFWKWTKICKGNTWTKNPSIKRNILAIFK